MKYIPIPARYSLMSYRLDQFWLPAAFWALFLFIAWLMRDDGNAGNAVDAFLCGVLPLISGVLAAYAVLDDPTLELTFATPRPAWQILLERLGLILAVVVAAALSFQAVVIVIGLDPTGGIPWAERQLHWLAPSLALAGLGSMAAHALAQCTFGAVAVGMAWIFQLIAQNWFIHEPTPRYFFLFIGAFAPDHPARAWTFVTLVVLTPLFLSVSWLLLKKQERFL